MATPATEGTGNTGVVGEVGSWAGARASEEAAHTASNTPTGPSLLQLGQFISHRLVSFGQLVEAFLGVLQQRLQGGNMTVTESELLGGHLEVQFELVVVNGQLVSGTGSKIKLLLQQFLS